MTGISVVAGLCGYHMWIKMLIFAVIKQCLLQQRETEASFVYIINHRSM